VSGTSRRARAGGGGRFEPGARWGALRMAAACALVHVVVLAPLRLFPLGDAPGVPWIAVEGLLLPGLLALAALAVPARALRWTAGVAAAAVVLVGVLGLVDAGFRLSLGRPVNLWLDLYLVEAVLNLSVGNLGWPRTLAAAAGIATAIGAVWLALAWLLAPSRSERRAGVRVGAMVAGAGVVLAALHGSGAAGWIASPSALYARQQKVLHRETRLERERFAAALQAPDRYADPPELLAGLAGRDVLLTYIESYGMSALEDPAWAAEIGPLLEEFETRLAEVGLHVATGRLVSPTVGGQSWYAHGTMLSGLWLENQLRYELLLASERETLVDDFRRAGHETVVVRPAITYAWPDAVRLGYDRVYTRPEIDYRGPPLYWVTVPDQYTMSFMQRAVRGVVGPRPRFIDTALLSSHSPWTPVLPVLPWDSLGDGSVFEPHARAGHPPEEVWWYTDLLRQDYVRSLEYSVRVVFEFAERYVDDRTLLLAPGDHQPLPWIMGDGAGSDVPMHVISGDPALLEPFLEWGFVPGVLPPPGPAAARMDQFREWFVRAFSGSVEP